METCKCTEMRFNFIKRTLGNFGFFKERPSNGFVFLFVKAETFELSTVNSPCLFRKIFRKILLRTLERIYL